MWRLLRFIQKKYRQRPLRGMSLAAAIAIGSGTVFYHYVEALNWIDALYFSVVTLTTVGYGDFSPQTNLGKLFTVFYILNGIGIMFGFINAYYEARLKHAAKGQTKDAKE